MCVYIVCYFTYDFASLFFASVLYEPLLFMSTLWYHVIQALPQLMISANELCQPLLMNTQWVRDTT